MSLTRRSLFRFFGAATTAVPVLAPPLSAAASAVPDAPASSPPADPPLYWHATSHFDTKTRVHETVIRLRLDRAPFFSPVVDGDIHFPALPAGLHIFRYRLLCDDGAVVDNYFTFSNRPGRIVEINDGDSVTLSTPAFSLSPA